VLCEEGDMTVETELKMPNNPYAKTFKAILLAINEILIDMTVVYISRSLRVCARKQGINRANTAGAVGERSS
jgi:hypothetical protein